MPRKRRANKAAAATGSSGEMLRKKAGTAASSDVVPMVHPGKGAAGSTGERLQKKAAAAASSGEEPMDPGHVPSGSGSSGEVLQKKAAAAASSGGAPTMDPGEGPCGSDSDSSSGGAPTTRTMDRWEVSSSSDSYFSGVGAPTCIDLDSSGWMLQKKAAAAASSGGAATMNPGEGSSGSNSTGGMLQKKAADMAPSGDAPTMDPWKGPCGSDSSGEMLQKKAVAAASSGGCAAVGSLQGNSTAQDREESDTMHRTKKPRTISPVKIPHEHCTEDDGNIGSVGMLQKQTPKVEAYTCLSGDMLHPKHLAEEADTGVSGDMLHKHPAEEADTAKGIQEPDSNEIVHVKEEDTRVLAVKDLIKKMNASCIGEQISSDEFLGYFNRLPCYPSIDLDDKLDDTAMDKQDALHGLYRFRYLKYQIQQQTSKGEVLDDKLKSLLDKSEDDCNQKFLEEEGFFRRFEEDWTLLDWFIHPDYEDCSSLTDYQRLVLRNYGDTEYIRWSNDHKYLHSYETEKEYVQYCEKLFEKLKWMDDYGDLYCPSFEWGYITTRGAYQAIKIAATDFQEITPALAYNGYNECEESMSYDATWFKGYGELYFEIWLRVTHKSISFKDALQEVCKLNMFPLRQRVMEAALECDYTMEWMEADYQTCTKAIVSGDTDEKARKLITEAVPTLVNKPKSYEKYIRKKIEIARIIGILPQQEGSGE